MADEESSGTMATQARDTIRIGLLGAAVLALGLMAGCRSAEEKALDTAKTQAATTNTPQQIQYVDKNGDTVTTVVQPPVAGQAQQITSNTASPPPGPPPHRTEPVVTPLGSSLGSSRESAQGLGTGGPSAANLQGRVPTPPVADQIEPSSPQAVLGGASTTQPASGPLTPGNAARGTSFTISAGTVLPVRMNQRIDVKHAAAGERFSGEIASPVEQGGSVVIPLGTPVSGRIDEAHRRGHFKGRSVLELRLVAMTLNGREYNLETRDSVQTKKGKGKRSSAFIGGLTGAGMLIGGLAGGGAGLGIGAAAGAGTGTLLAGATGNRDIVIPAESVVRFRLANSLEVQNP